MLKCGTYAVFVEFGICFLKEQNFLQMFLWHKTGCFDVSISLYFKPIGILFLLFNNEN